MAPKVLWIGLDPNMPALVKPDYDPNKLNAILDAEIARVREVGFDLTYKWLMSGDPEKVGREIGDWLEGNEVEGVCIGAGIRLITAFTPLFERLVEIVHERAPKARLVFNAKPNDAVEAFQRALGH